MHVCPSLLLTHIHTHTHTHTIYVCVSLSLTHTHTHARTHQHVKVMPCACGSIMWLAKMLQEGAARHLKLHLSLLEDHSPEDVRLGLWLAPVVVDDLLEADLFQLGNLADAVDS